ncbi:GDSL Lipase/Acylhydrolase family protein [Penicillium verhagenii]|nr:GDSL Lipase/Acylhydrolase family protein [Penicillium verhagenii]
MTVSDEVFGKPYDQFLLFGDSITEMSCNQDLGFGFQPALQDVYCRRLDVLNRGFSGYSTAHAIKVFPKFFPSPETATVRFIAIFFGANDAAVPGHNQHIPLEQYKENLRQITQHPAMLAQNPHIIFITPPPVNEYQLEGFDYDKNTVHPSRTAAITKTYAEGMKELGASLKIPVVDIWSAFTSSVGWKEGQPLIGSREAPNSKAFGDLFTDGLHLTPAGYRIVNSELLNTLKANWPGQGPEALPMVYPPWPEAPK